VGSRRDEAVPRIKTDALQLKGRYWEIAGSKFPEDIARLRKQYFSSDERDPRSWSCRLSRPREKWAAHITIHVGVGPAGRNGLRLERLGDEARDRVYAAAEVQNSRV
jgi:hypothetical protein